MPKMSTRSGPIKVRRYSPAARSGPHIGKAALSYGATSLSKKGAKMGGGSYKRSGKLTMRSGGAVKY